MNCPDFFLSGTHWLWEVLCRLYQGKGVTIPTIKQYHTIKGLTPKWTVQISSCQVLIVMRSSMHIVPRQSWDDPYNITVSHDRGTDSNVNCPDFFLSGTPWLWDVLCMLYQGKAETIPTIKQYHMIEGLTQSEMSRCLLDRYSLVMGSSKHVVPR